VSPTGVPVAGANALLALLVRHARQGHYEGFLSELGGELGYSPSWVSRAIGTLVDAGRVEIEVRGHGQNPSRVRIVSTEPLDDAGERPGRSALADRLLAHLDTLSDDGVVERPLVEVARQLRVGAPSVSRALGQLVDEGLARVDVVGTRSRPTRIELAPADNGGGHRSGTGTGEQDRLEAELREARAEIAALRAELRSARRHA
jgi:DNA-binding MarR family transcriptional regulator